MSSLTRIVIESRASAAEIAEFIAPQVQESRQAIARLARWLTGMAGGGRDGTLELCTGAVKATATLTMTGLPSDTNTFVLCGTTFTARASGASGNEFNIGATATLTAVAIAAAVNASATAKVTASVVATSSEGVVTFTALVPGTIGNGFVLTESMDNTTRVDFASGSNGTKTALVAGAAS